MPFCTGNTIQEKIDDHQQISFGSFKKYSVDVHEKILGKVIFPKDERYHNGNKAFNVLQKLTEVVNKIASLKTASIKKYKQ